MSSSETEIQEKHSVSSLELGNPGNNATATDIKNRDEAPDGGLRAWLVTAGACCVFFSALGFSNAFGVFQEYYMTHQLKDQSPDKVAWIGSLAVFLQFMSGNMGGPLFDRFGAWVCGCFLRSPTLLQCANVRIGTATCCSPLCFCRNDDQLM